MNVNRNFEFERFVRSAISKNSVGTIVGIVILGALGLFFVGFGIAIPFFPLIIIGLLPIGGIFLVISNGQGDLKGGDYWVNVLSNEPQKVVWIKPINVKHTAYLVVTLYNEMHYQVWCTDGLSFQIKCDTPQDQFVFLSGLKQYVPHAHIGYTETIENFYKANPKSFIGELQKYGMYHAVHHMQV